MDSFHTIIMSTTQTPSLWYTDTFHIIIVSTTPTRFLWYTDSFHILIMTTTPTPSLWYSDSFHLCLQYRLFPSDILTPSFHLVCLVCLQHRLLPSDIPTPSNYVYNTDSLPLLFRLFPCTISNLNPASTIPILSLYYTNSLPLSPAIYILLPSNIAPPFLYYTDSFLLASLHLLLCLEHLVDITLFLGGTSGWYGTVCRWNIWLMWHCRCIRQYQN